MVYWLVAIIHWHGCHCLISSYIDIPLTVYTHITTTTTIIMCYRVPGIEFVNRVLFTNSVAPLISTPRLCFTLILYIKSRVSIVICGHFLHNVICTLIVARCSGGGGDWWLSGLLVGWFATSSDTVFCVSAGHVPGRPQGGRHGMVFGQIPVAGTPTGTASSMQVPLVPGRVCRLHSFINSFVLCLSLGLCVHIKCVLVGREAKIKFGFAH